jgi:uncharacterized membrane protein (UPF0127 family)
MKKLLITLGVFLVAILILGVAYQNQNILNQNVKYDTPVEKETFVKINENLIRVEMATTNAQKAKGLSQRKYLGKDDGMLFDLRNDNPPHVFWMKDMLIPIDIVWINERKIIKINEAVQPPLPNTPDTQLEKLIVMENVDYVLEVNTSYTSSHNVMVGDLFEFTQN